jgi:pimeloyl-ACP methyl ester carboxylesterase
MTEPTRPIRQPTVDRDGSLVAHTVATPTSFKIRARVTVGSRKVIPVIFVPGIMGSNLKVRGDVALPEGAGIVPGEAAWRPPNGAFDAWREARKWEKRDPAQRQVILDPALLEVDNMGELDYAACSLEQQEMRERGWGEVHAASYGSLLVDLQRQLDKTFRVNSRGERDVREYWKRVMKCDPARWGVRSIEPVTEAELEKYAGYQYPVYAVGYNWLASCAVSAQRLGRRIKEIKQYWTSRKHECEKVILVTHSMGGLVARACAKLSAGNSDDIAGVIHGVMPALGAPVVYRRLACGTEGAHYDKGPLDNRRADLFSEIVGSTAAHTTPVMATSPGVLELLPNQFYPQPWLIVRAVSTVNNEQRHRDLLTLPQGNPYDFYRDMSPWYSMVNLALVDPARRYQTKNGGARDVVTRAIDRAEKLHKQVLADTKVVNGAEVSQPYYHRNTYAYYGADDEHRAFGQILWAAQEPVGNNALLTPGNVKQATPIAYLERGAREVEVEGSYRVRFKAWTQEVAGDDTVPHQSGAGPKPYIKQIFATRGYGHQTSFEHSDMLLLTRHLIVKIVQGLK